MHYDLHESKWPHGSAQQAAWDHWYRALAVMLTVNGIESVQRFT